MTYGPFTSEYALTKYALSISSAMHSEREYYERCSKHYEDLKVNETEQDFYVALAWKNEAEHAKYALAILARLAEDFTENLTSEALEDFHATFHYWDDCDKKKVG